MICAAEDWVFSNREMHWIVCSISVLEMSTKIWRRASLKIDDLDRSILYIYSELLIYLLHIDSSLARKFWAPISPRDAKYVCRLLNVG